MTKNTFSDGAAYEQFMGRWSSVVGAVFLDWIEPEKGACWLDIGCGTGVFTELVLNKCYPSKVVAVDPSAAQIELAGSKAIAKQAEFHVADAQNLPFSDAEFDIVASALVINFIPDRPRGIAEMRRVGRPGGMVAGYVWDFAAERNPTSPIRSALSEIGAKPPLASGTDDSRLEALSSLFALSGFENIETRTIDVAMSFPNFDEFWRTQNASYSPTGKIISKLSETELEKLINIVRASLPVDHDGKITYSSRANAIKARIIN